MRNKLAVALERNVYDGLRRVVGLRRIGKLIDELALHA